MNKSEVQYGEIELNKKTYNDIFQIKIVEEFHIEGHRRIGKNMSHLIFLPTGKTIYRTQDHRGIELLAQELTALFIDLVDTVIITGKGISNVRVKTDVDSPQGLEHEEG